MTYWLFDLDAAAILQVSHGRRAKDTLADLDSVVALPGAAELPVPEVLVTAEDVDVGKPDPAGYLLAARRLGADPAECIVVEDTPAGLEAGRRAGCHVIAVATSHSPGQLAGYEVVPDLTCLHLPT